MIAGKGKSEGPALQKNACYQSGIKSVRHANDGFVMITDGALPVRSRAV
jgi:hypothetical protein